MTGLSRRILDRIDLSAMREARQGNYRLLLEGVRDSPTIRPLYDELPADVCPLGFPVLVADRGRLRQHLIGSRIYPPIHWLLPDSVWRLEFPVEWFISDHILTIPIDHRYDQKDMERVLRVLNRYRDEAFAWHPGS